MSVIGGISRTYLSSWWFNRLFDVCQMTQTPDIFSLVNAAWEHTKYPCFCILPLEFGVNIDICKHENSEVLCSNRNNPPPPPPKKKKKCLGTVNCKNMENMLIDVIWLNVQPKYLIQAILYHFK